MLTFAPPKNALTGPARFLPAPEVLPSDPEGPRGPPESTGGLPCRHLHRGEFRPASAVITSCPFWEHAPSDYSERASLVSPHNRRHGRRHRPNLRTMTSTRPAVNRPFFD